jgi:hypothetical protein
MKAQLTVLLHALLEYQHQLAIAYFCLAGLSWKYWLKIRAIFWSGVLIPTAATLAVVTIFTYLSVVIFYLMYPNYLDHLQPTVASISWLWMEGHELYPNWMTDDVYGSVNGPVLFLLNGVALLLKPSIFVSKLPGILSLGAALGVAWILFKRTTDNSLLSLLLLASLLLLLEIFSVYAYWNRSEPFLILISVLAFLIASRSSSWVAGVSIGVLAGLAVGLKVYGFICVIPAAAVALARVETLGGRLFWAIIGSLFAAASAVFPYLEKHVSIMGHLRFIRAQLDQRWSISLFEENLLIVVVLTVPIFVLWSRRKQPLNASDRWLFAALGLSAATLTVLGAKVGAGSHYLLPLVPIFMYGIARGCAFETEAKQIIALVFVSFFLAYGPNLFLNWRGLKYFYQDLTPSQREQIAELKTYLNLYPDAQIGVSDDAHYTSYYYRVLPVWKGRPLHVDFALWMSLAYVNVDEERIMRFIRGCAVQTWILPLGEPFTKLNYFTNLPIVSDSFRQTFSSTYEQIKTGRAYQIWQCKLAH